MFKSHVYIELGWGDDGYQHYLPPCHPLCANFSSSSSFFFRFRFSYQDFSFGFICGIILDLNCV